MDQGAGSKYRRFYWQRGYGAFSVSPSQLKALLEYVESQEEHHRTRTFQEEYCEFLRKYGVEFENAICGTEADASVIRAFSAHWGKLFPGRCPRLI